MIRIGVIGYGYWGPNLVRNFFEAPEVQVVAVSDLRADRLAALGARYPTIQITSNYRELIDDPSIDAVAVATPVSTHYELALRALQAGKHVLVEKPLASDTDQVQHLMDVARKRNLVLMVDHTFVYTGAVRKIRELVESGGLGEIYYYDSVRVNLGLFQHDVNVLWDLAVHDLAIMDYVLPFRPCAVSATGLSHVPGGTENIAYLTLFFEGSQIAHIHANWLAPVKLRRTLIGANRKMIVYDDLEQSEKIKVYDKGITLNHHQTPEKLYQMLVGYRTGDMLAPQIDGTEALHREIEHFLNCIREQQEPVTGGSAGLRVVEILQAASQSMAQHGRPVELRLSTLRATA
ncbi:MAG TPA: Gfo/Idh/MocA family oxidoreductase [Candidatus Sulfotelmatobacter sp.]|nr:Gfo/Idh/MocA family oxidoreductase [Candidatus Sulfotelmatobacter sp.]